MRVKSVDDYSKWCEVYFLTSRDDALVVFKKYKKFA